ncbi:MAG: 50S ribosomal protein L23 [Planctomycetes bacterium]|nr:50S ribosomal protein L23 [Planctomycetota bacterium]
MDPYNVIRRSVITEKSLRLRNDPRGKTRNPINGYTFEVHPDATKPMIKEAVEKIFNVRVARVNTSAARGKERRVRRVLGRTKDWKKAVVFLAEGNNIELY